MMSGSEAESYLDRIAVFDSITVSRPRIEKKRISGTITIVQENSRKTFDLIFSYREDIDVDENLAGLILTMPVINFTLFAREVVLEYPVTGSDLAELKKFIEINNTEVFINKLCRRRYEFFRKEYLPDESIITQETARGATRIRAEIADKRQEGEHPRSDPQRIMVLSSGGKESLLTYGILMKSGFRAHPIFFNESGAHWRAAKTSFEYLSATNPDTTKVWSNVDRFYRFCLRNLTILEPSMITFKADVYPVQLFIFAVYIFAMLPVALKHGVSSLLMGNEYDDPREMPLYHGVKHYYEIYDQTWDFTSEISQYFHEKGMELSVMSILYPVGPTIVERTLFQDFPELLQLQRSCHSCSVRSGMVVPCGVCSKCKGVILLILAAGGDPRQVGYLQEHIDAAKKDRSGLRLDTEEIKYLYGELTGDTQVTGIHIFPDENESFSRLPRYLGEPIREIFRKHTEGDYELRDNEWIRIQK